MLLWLCHRLKAEAPIRSPAWELPYAMGAALKRPKKKKERKKEKEKERNETNKKSEALEEMRLR